VSERDAGPAGSGEVGGRAAPYVEQALGAVHQEYPNQPKYVLRGDEDVAPPRHLTPAFYGCFDWHSAVHGHWTLARALRLWPAAPFAGRAAGALDGSLTPEKTEAERAFLEPRPAFEMPYGISWLLTLSAELHRHPHPGSDRWRAALEPLVATVSPRLARWLEGLPGPIRTGEHNQTAFAMGLALDAARTAGDADLEARVAARARDFHLEDRGVPLAWEPSAHDFLSPALAEADLMRRVMDAGEFAGWLAGFLPALDGAGDDWLLPCPSPDPGDGKLVHRVGLNLSRAWMLRAIGAALPAEDPRRAVLAGAASGHEEAGLPGALTGHYAGAHWLGTFAVYLIGGGAGPVTS